MGKRVNKTTFYSTKGVISLVLIMLFLAILAFSGMSALGVIRVPSSISELFNKSDESDVPQNVVNINAFTEPYKLTETLTREEYASALASMDFNDEFYQSYTISIISGKTKLDTKYDTVFCNGDWWIQKSNDSVIYSTALCKDGTVMFTDNTQNATQNLKEKSEEFPDGLGFEELCGILKLETLTSYINMLEDDETVKHGGSNISQYSLTFMPARGSGDNRFIFTFSTESGIKEEYTFSFENAMIISVNKYYNDNQIFKMQSDTFYDDLSFMDINSLFE